MKRVSSGWRTWARVAAFLVAGSAAGLACSSESSRRLAAGCTINTDCNQPLVCAFQRCHNACTDSRDCPAGLHCVSSDRPYRVCQLPGEADCSRTSDCPGTEQCAVDGQCHDRCASTADCVSRQVCVASSCADTDALGPDGQLLPDADASVLIPCSYSSECPDALVCRSGVCQFECLSTRDCARGESCVQNQCVTPSTPGVDGGAGSSGQNGGGGMKGSEAGTGGASGGPDASVTGVLGAPCDYPSDCPGLRCGPRGTCVYECSMGLDCAADQCCQAHRCITGIGCDVDAGIAPSPDAGGGARCSGDLDCQNGITCDGFERCSNGHCRPAAAAACDDADPCTTDTCDEKKGACSHEVTGPVDQDGDGHYAIGAACGASSARADDCDDKNPNVYPGHPELCDEVDNNCNGVADEGVWQLGAPLALTKGSDFPVGNAGGTETTPAVVKTSDGFSILATADGTTGAVQAFRLSTAGKLLGSATLATAVGIDCMTTSGKRVAYPTLASDGTNLLAGFLQAVPQANSCCAANARWTRSILGELTSGDLSKSTPLRFDDDVDTDCTTATSSARLGTVSTVWVPSLSRYVASWVDPHDGGGSQAFVSTVTPAGVLGGAHTVTAGEADSVTGNFFFPQSLLAASPSGIFVAFPAVSSLRMALLDPTSLSAVVGPLDLPNSFQAVPVAVAYSNGRFFLARTTRGTLSVSALDATSLTELRVASISVSADSVFSPRLIAVGNGVMFTFSRSATRLAYGWAPATFDAPGTEVFPLTDVDLGGPVSGAGIAMLDDKHVAVSWVDGAVKAALLTCGQ